MYNEVAVYPVYVSKEWMLYLGVFDLTRDNGCSCGCIKNLDLERTSLAILPYNSGEAKQRTRSLEDNFDL